VTIHVLQGGMAREIVDTHGLFGGDEAADVAGFRVMNADGGSDWLAFLGASYFRASGPTGQYGLSRAPSRWARRCRGRRNFPPSPISGSRRMARIGW
jgi:glucans biosynthesis protein